MNTDLRKPNMVLQKTFFKFMKNAVFVKGII